MYSWTWNVNIKFVHNCLKYHLPMWILLPNVDPNFCYLDAMEESFLGTSPTERKSFFDFHTLLRQFAKWYIKMNNNSTYDIKKHKSSMQYQRHFWNQLFLFHLFLLWEKLGSYFYWTLGSIRQYLLKINLMNDDSLLGLHIFNEYINWL